MSGLITGYDPKTQNFIDTDLFDVSKHVTQTSGVLEVGVSYTILDFQTGDNFTNVGGTNVTGNVFVATGTTPTTYTNGSTLAKYVTQSYTYAELKVGLGLGSKVYKALLTQTGTDAPVATVLVNTLSGTPAWSRVSVGYYKLTLASEFTNDKTYYPPFGQMGNILSDGSPGIPMFDDTGGAYGYIQLYKLSTSEFVLKSYNSSFASVDLSDIIGTGNISLPPIEVFP